MAAPVTLNGNGSVDAGNPTPLFSVRPGTEFSASRDGERFLLDTLTDDVVSPNHDRPWKPPAR
jgi:hypothetical protein